MTSDRVMWYSPIVLRPHKRMYLWVLVPIKVLMQDIKIEAVPIIDTVAGSPRHTKKQSTESGLHVRPIVWGRKDGSEVLPPIHTTET